MATVAIRVIGFELRSENFVPGTSLIGINAARIANKIQPQKTIGCNFHDWLLLMLVWSD